MEQYHGLLLKVWREAGQHIEIGEAVERITPLLTRRLPVDLVLVRMIDVQRNTIETVGVGLCRAGEPPKETRQPCRGEEIDSLLTWCRLGKVAHEHLDVDRAESGLQTLMPSGTGATEVLIGGLNTHEGPAGVVLFAARSPRRFSPEHVAIAEALLEPFSAALEIHHRLDEMDRLRETAEADKRSLLTRLGREDIADTIVGADGGLRAVMERINLVAHTDAPVLIFGETGSGKEVIARAIHMRSHRGSGPFLRVNCGAIPSELIDSELFGHERGSFTGAVSTRQGWFERADGGTLFLDEIGELPLAAQVRMLRILQDGSFERVGGQRQLKVNVRIIGATHRDLQQMVKDGKFREDLWYRLAVFPVHLPSLRERVEDIPALATHFALKACRRFGTPAQVPSPDDINLLVGYPWPGNVRELGSVMERAVILGSGRGLEVAKALGTGALPRAPDTADDKRERIGTAPDPQHRQAPFQTLDAAMAAHIRAALEITHGRVEGPHGAAKLLKINPHTLRARMRKLGVNLREFRSVALG